MGFGAKPQWTWTMNHEASGNNQRIIESPFMGLKPMAWPQWFSVG
ncbi:MAG TPA: hypothetical protein PLO02_03750 [Tenuifilaceae bacterium]|nr:hypothetical protein [Bacteroidales bacterium]MDI9515712.1 hypothetical protein [Bacteroidota bacterium]HNV82208.1 hypothetical protein [Tenuifilaceae bacterium]HOF92082.1 hypothetical protein [Tenuifilaceae bacterium]HOM84832.1 hypothetical protein [Tenuifilaceae bacterium]